MNGQTLQKAFVPLPSGGQAVYNATSLLYYGHPDHLGNIRFASTWSRTMYFDLAYAPFGEPYATSGTADLSFTGQRQDTVAGLYDFPAREYSIQGRWPSPDPAGLAAVDPSNPQSWNRYAYVLNNPLKFTDPTGLYCVWDDGGFDDSPGDGGIDQGGCTVGGGTWVDQPSAPDTVDVVTADPLPPITNPGYTDPSQGGGLAPFNPVASQLIAFEESGVSKFIQNGVNLLGCASDAIAGEIPFAGKYLSNSPDPVGNKLRSAANAISPNPDAKTLGLIPNNLAVNTQRVVTSLDKLDLPQLSEAAAAASSKFAPYAPFISKAFGMAGWGYMAYNATRNTNTCMKNGGPDF